jgi:signal transduction histidine kinase
VERLRHPGDLALPAAVAVVAVVEVVAYAPPQLALAVAALVTACAALVARRRAPLLSASVAAALVLLLAFAGPELDELASPVLVVAVAGFALGRYVGGVRGALPLLAVAAALLVSEVPEAVDPTDVVFLAALLTPPYAVGLVTRALAIRNEQLAAQAELLLALQAQVRGEAVRAERTRIARELHDVIAHSISAMVVQATAAQELVRSDPERAARALSEVTETGRQSLAETGRLLHLIRDEDDELGVAPDVGLDRLDDLVEQFRRSGLRVDLTVDGQLDHLPPGVAVSGYRLVQEALTNALKHAADGAARVRLSRGVASLEIEAENRVADQRGPGSGLGLVGMAERVHAFGGQLRHGTTADGRFVLQARLPLPVAAE